MRALINGRYAMTVHVPPGATLQQIERSASAQLTVQGYLLGHTIVRVKHGQGSLDFITQPTE